MGIVQIVIIVLLVVLMICLILVGIWFSTSKKVFNKEGKIKDTKEYYRRLRMFLRLSLAFMILGALLATFYRCPMFLLSSSKIKTVETEIRKRTKVTELYPIQNDDIYVLSYADSLFYLTKNEMIKVNNLYNTDFDAADEYIETYKIRKKAYLTSDKDEKWPLYVWPKSDAYQIHLKGTEEMSFLNTPK